MNTPKQTALDIISDFEQLGMDKAMAVKSAQVFMNHLKSAVPTEPCNPSSDRPRIDVFKFWLGVETEINRQPKAATTEKRLS